MQIYLKHVGFKLQSTTAGSWLIMNSHFKCFELIFSGHKKFFARIVLNIIVMLYIAKGAVNTDDFISKVSFEK